jgi:hypothetical protein
MLAFTMKDLSFEFPSFLDASRDKIDPLRTLSDEKHHLNYHCLNNAFNQLKSGKVGELTMLLESRDIQKMLLSSGRTMLNDN